MATRPTIRTDTAMLVGALRDWLRSPPPHVSAWCVPYARKCVFLGLAMDRKWRRAAVRILEWYPSLSLCDRGPVAGWLGTPAGTRVFVQQGR
jgi:hypothetical protein